MKEYIIKIGDEPDIMGNYPLTEKAKELVRCKDCKHRPTEPEDAVCGADYNFPDEVCPCRCDEDEWYSWMPSDNWYCPKGER